MASYLMKYFRSIHRLLFIVALVSGLLSPLRADESPAIPDFTAGGKRGESHDWLLGPTGLRGWMFWRQKDLTVSHVYFIRALAEAGRSDILHRVYSRDGKGSYGGILSKGLTSLPESWDAMMDGVRSLNHCMLGHVMEWFYGYVGGIRQAPGSVGWKNILIAPNPGPLASSEATLQTPNGRVVSRWSKDGETFRLETEIPEGVSATAILPSGEMKELRSGKQTLKEPVQMPK